MGTNIIHLADYLVPSYRRTRPASAQAPQPPASRAAPTHQLALGLSEVAATASPPAGDPATSWQAQAQRRARQRPADQAGATGQQAPGTPSPPHGRVRVLRAHGGTAGPEAGTRLRISGRLIDVCAELERLAAAEAQAATRPLYA